MTSPTLSLQKCSFPLIDLFLGGGISVPPHGCENPLVEVDVPVKRLPVALKTSPGFEAAAWCKHILLHIGLHFICLTSPTGTLGHGKH